MSALELETRAGRCASEMCSRGRGFLLLLQSPECASQQRASRLCTCSKNGYALVCSSSSHGCPGRLSSPLSALSRERWQQRRVTTALHLRSEPQPLCMAAGARACTRACASSTNCVHFWPCGTFFLRTNTCVCGVGGWMSVWYPT